MIFPHYLVVNALALAIDWLCLIALTSLAHIAAGALASMLAGNPTTCNAPRSGD